MRVSKLAVVVIVIAVLFAIITAIPSFRVKYDIPESNPIVSTAKQFGLINPDKIYDGAYHIDRLVKAPPVFFSNGHLQLGLDLQGGTYVSMRADMSGVQDSEKINKLNALRAVIERRINQFGVSETNVYTTSGAGEYKIVVELPGSGETTDSQIAILKNTAKLEILFPKDTESAAISPATLFQIGGIELLKQYYVDSGVGGADLVTAFTSLNSSSTDATASQYAVTMTFTADGAKRFNDKAKANLNHYSVIILDNNILSIPLIPETYAQSSGNTDQVSITGSFTQKEADELAIQLRGGALPVPVSIAEQRIIEPSLGKDALQKSIIAGGIGILGVMLFMIIRYGINGLIASLALLLYTLFSISAYKIFAIHLTLAGVAGLLLSIGIAVDANILIFERMKEEMENGNHSPSTALKLGYEKAWTSIRDSNVSTLITCFILSSFGSTVTKGFAYNLAIGVLISMFSAIVVVKQLLLIFRKDLRS